MQVRGFARAVALGFSAVALSALAFASPAGAGGQPPSDVTPLTVVKTVSGPVPAGTTFTATVECDDDIIEVGLDVTDTATVTFSADGQPTSADTVVFDDPGTCTVTETATGGAATTTYACASEVVEAGTSEVEGQQVLQLCGTAGPQSDPITINPEVVEGSITVTIHNTFVESPQAAPQVVAQPVFTG